MIIIKIVTVILMVVVERCSWEDHGYDCSICVIETQLYDDIDRAFI